MFQVTGTLAEDTITQKKILINGKTGKTFLVDLS